jgi:NADPH:quinone reductase-like Zn-dependent oxidoreductase
MLCTLTCTVAALIFLYTLIAYIKKKLTKPNYTGKTVWITGAASGIGEQLAY